MDQRELFLVELSGEFSNRTIDGFLTTCDMLKRGHDHVDVLSSGLNVFLLSLCLISTQGDYSRSRGCRASNTATRDSGGRSVLVWTVLWELLQSRCMAGLGFNYVLPEIILKGRECASLIVSSNIIQQLVAQLRSFLDVTLLETTRKRFKRGERGSREGQVAGRTGPEGFPRWLFPGSWSEFANESQSLPFQLARYTDGGQGWVRRQ